MIQLRWQTQVQLLWQLQLMCYLGSLNGVFFTDATTSKPTYANHLKHLTLQLILLDSYLMILMKGLKYKVLVHLRKPILVMCRYRVCSGSSPNFVSGVEISGTMAAAAAQLKIIGASKDPDNNELGSANRT